MGVFLRGPKMVVFLLIALQNQKTGYQLQQQDAPIIHWGAKQNWGQRFKTNGSG